MWGWGGGDQRTARTATRGGRNAHEQDKEEYRDTMWTPTPRQRNDGKEEAERERGREKERDRSIQRVLFSRMMRAAASNRVGCFFESAAGWSRDRMRGPDVQLVPAPPFPLFISFAPLFRRSPIVNSLLHSPTRVVAPVAASTYLWIVDRSWGGRGVDGLRVLNHRTDIASCRVNCSFIVRTWWN